jgi:hypothetical protein
MVKTLARDYGHKQNNTLSIDQLEEERSDHSLLLRPHANVELVRIDDSGLDQSGGPCDSVAYQRDSAASHDADVLCSCSGPYLDNFKGDRSLV